MKRIFTLLIFSLVLNVGNAQLKLKNSSNKPVFVAYAMQSNEKGSDAWWTYGWYACDPNETITISSAVGLSPNVYYYAKSKDGKTVWNGTNRDGSANLLVHNTEAFKIKNANMDYVAKEHPEYSWLSFRLIKIPVYKAQYTIEIN
jgi:uncharacterized membrane protein